MPPMLTLLLIAILFAVCVVARRLTSSAKASRGRFPYPPGPKPLPVIGNARDVPKTAPWEVYTEWEKTYGNLMYISVLGQNIVIVNSRDVANDLFQKRAAVYSDRPASLMLKLINWDFATGFLPYGNTWRAHRRIFRQSFRADATLALRSNLISKTHRLLRQLLDTPQDFLSHIRTLSNSTIMSTIYGHEISLQDDHLVDINETAMSMLSTMPLIPSALVNTFPMLRHTPSWFPGAGFKRYADVCRKLTTELQETPLNTVKQKMEIGNITPSLVWNLLEKNRTNGGPPEYETLIKHVAATAYSAASDTSISALASFILAMMLYPEVQKKAQDQIDCVVGSGKLPDFNDRESLPYVDAIYRELMRWRPPVPLGLPHATTQDDVYNGYFIPKGTSILGNIWAMAHNEDSYPDPTTFRPERFLTEDGQLNDDSTILAFGFGRRVCAGQHMAETSIWIVLVTVLAAFDITKPKDEVGRDVDVKWQYTDGLVSHLLPFPCVITPRSADTRQLVLDTGHEAQCSV